MVDGAAQQRLIAALGYAFTPVVPIVVLATDMKDDRFMRRHAGQALVWSVGFIVLLVVVILASIWLVRRDLLFILLVPLLFHVPFLPGGIWGISVYRGGDPRPPLVAPLAGRLFRER